MTCGKHLSISLQTYGLYTFQSPGRILSVAEKKGGSVKRWCLNRRAWWRMLGLVRRKCICLLARILFSHYFHHTLFLQSYNLEWCSSVTCIIYDSCPFEIQMHNMDAYCKWPGNSEQYFSLFFFSIVNLSSLLRVSTVFSPLPQWLLQLIESGGFLINSLLSNIYCWLNAFLVIYLSLVGPKLLGTCVYGGGRYPMHSSRWVKLTWTLPLLRICEVIGLFKLGNMRV